MILCLSYIIFDLTSMSKRFREAFIATAKPSKKSRTEDEETRAEDDARGDPGALKNFLSNKRMIELLEEKGIKSLFPIQYRTYDAIFAGKDVKAKDKTGSGKTLAFSLPVIEHFRKDKRFQGKNPKFLVMLPTRELVIQVVNNIQALRLTEDEFSVVGVYGGDPIAKQTTRLGKGADVVVATPGRLIDMIDRGVVNFSDLLVTCLDEADEMLKQGFQESIEKIFKEISQKRRQKTQNLLFSATFPSWIVSLSAKYQTSDALMVDLVPKETEMPTTITHYLMNVRADTMPLVINKLIDHFTSKKGKTIVFCQTKRGVSSLCERLGEGTAMLHGDVKQFDREKIYRDFKSGKITTIVATNVAARGLDFPDIQLVIQTEPPREVESFIHRAGRTGRAGKSGVNVMLTSTRNDNQVEKIKAVSKVSFQPLSPDSLGKFK